jgi:hypothetical protein
MQTYSSHGNCFYMYLKFISVLQAFDFLSKFILTCIRTTKKHDFCHFPFARLLWLVEEIEKLKLMRTIIVIRQLRQFLSCSSACFHVRYATHRNLNCLGPRGLVGGHYLEFHTYNSHEKLFLHVADVHTYLAGFEKALF